MRGAAEVALALPDNQHRAPDLHLHIFLTLPRSSTPMPMPLAFGSDMGLRKVSTTTTHKGRLSPCY